MFDPLTIAEVLKKDRDGTAYAELAQRLQEVENIEAEKDRLQELIRDYENKDEVFQRIMEFAKLLTHIDRNESDWRLYYALVNRRYYGESFDRQAEIRMRKLSAEKIIDIAHHLNYGPKYWRHQDFLDDVQGILKDLDMKIVERHKIIDRKDNEIEDLNKRLNQLNRQYIEQCAVQQQKIDELNEFSLWQRVKFLFGGDLK